MKINELVKEHGMSRQRVLKEQFKLFSFFEEQTAREKTLKGLIG